MEILPWRSANAPTWVYPPLTLDHASRAATGARNVSDVDYDTNAISNAITAMYKQADRPQDMIYGDGSAGVQIADTARQPVDLSIEKMLTY